MVAMRQSQWELRCYAECQAPSVWVATCLDFDLAAQGETFEDARCRLDAMINEYVEDALTGEDRDHAQSLLNRRAPLRYWLRYYWFALVRSIRPHPSRSRQPFRESLHLARAQ
jgi:predicted RNase H-like HicB family nuclease